MATRSLLVLVAVALLLLLLLPREVQVTSVEFRGSRGLHHAPEHLAWWCHSSEARRSNDKLCHGVDRPR